MKTKKKTKTKTRPKKKTKPTTTIRRPARLPATARDMLNLIDRFLVARAADRLDFLAKSEAGKLWDVLSAMRGPDFESRAIYHDFKSELTIPIRRAALPLTAAFSRLHHHDIAACFDGPETLPPSAADQLPTDTLNVNARHFPAHIRAAARALGMEIPPKTV